MKMMMLFLLMIVLYGSNQIESQKTELKRYTLVELNNDYPWLFDDAAEQDRTKERSITITNCHFESTFLLWPAMALRKLLFMYVSLDDPLDLSTIPVINDLFFHSFDHNPVNIIKQSKFPPVIINLTFGKDAVHFIKFIQTENFATTVDRIRIHAETLLNYPKVETDKILKKLGKLLAINLQHMLTHRVKEKAKFYEVDVYNYKCHQSIKKEPIHTQLNSEVKLYNGETMKREYPWFCDSNQIMTMAEPDKQITIRDGSLENGSIIWPPTHFYSIHLDHVLLIDPFDLSVVPQVDFLTLRALDHNSPKILRQCKFPPKVFELRFDEDAVRMIKYIEPENFSTSVVFIKIHQPSWDTKLKRNEQNKLVNKMCELLQVDEPTLYSMLSKIKYSPFDVIDLRKSSLTKKFVESFTNHQQETPDVSISETMGRPTKLTDNLHQETPAEDETISTVSEVKEHSNLLTDDPHQETSVVSQKKEHPILRNTDLRTKHTKKAFDFNNYSLDQISVQWPEFPVRSLFFVDIIFLDPLDLQNIPFVDKLGFSEIDKTTFDIFHQSKLPKIVNILMFGNGSLKMITNLRSDFPLCVNSLLIDKPSFIEMDIEAQKHLLVNLCKLLTQSTKNLESCAQHLKETYFDTMLQEEYILLEPMQFSPIDARKFMFRKDLTTTFVNLSYADEISFMNLQLKSRVVIWPTTDIFSINFFHVTFIEPFDLSGISSVTTMTFSTTDHNERAIFALSKFPKKVRSLTFQENSLNLIHAIPTFSACGIEKIFIHQKSFEALSIDAKEEFVTNLLLICLDREDINVCTDKIKKSIDDGQKGLIRIALLE